MRTFGITIQKEVNEAITKLDEGKASGVLGVKAEILKNSSRDQKRSARNVPSLLASESLSTRRFGRTR